MKRRKLKLAANGCIALSFPEDSHLLPKEWNGRYPRKTRREFILKLSEQQNHRCCYCGVVTWTPYDNGVDVPERTGPKETRASVEHLMTRRNGGTNKKGNVVMACAACNTQRDQKNPYLFMMDKHGRLDQFSLLPIKEDLLSSES